MSEHAPYAAAPRDRLNRPLRDLRISVTDRCNLRCTYCMPEAQYGANYRFVPHAELLSFEEIARVAEAAARLGVTKLRVTGGEPLLRRELDKLMAMLRAIPGVEDLALTTNGLLLEKHAAALGAAGLDRVTVSLDSLDPEIFAAMSGGRNDVAAVLSGIEAARQAGLGPIKVNAVVQRGVNDEGILELARHFRHTGIALRFIEYMDTGASAAWRPELVVPSAELHARIHAEFPLRPLGRAHPGEVAERHAYADGAGEVGFISSVSQPFCGGCSRLRLSADGTLYTCLFAGEGVSIKSLVRGGAAPAGIAAAIEGLWRARADRYSEERAAIRAAGGKQKVAMHHIGG